LIACALKTGDPGRALGIMAALFVCLYTRGKL
jgi:hypothetical protein